MCRSLAFQKDPCVLQMCIIDVESEIWMRRCFVCVDWRMHGRLAAISLSCPVADEKRRGHCHRTRALCWPRCHPDTRLAKIRGSSARRWHIIIHKQKVNLVLERLRFVRSISFGAFTSFVFDTCRSWVVAAWLFLGCVPLDRGTGPPLYSFSRWTGTSSLLLWRWTSVSDLATECVWKSSSLMNLGKLIQIYNCPRLAKDQSQSQRFDDPSCPLFICQLLIYNNYR
jgi:hypothetical protein